MAKFMVGVLCLVGVVLSATASNAFERARHGHAAVKTLLDQKATISPCHRRAPLSRIDYPKCPAAPVKYPKSNEKSGFAFVSVVDENESPIPGFCVRIGGKNLAPAPVAAYPLDEGDTLIEVFHEDVGNACQQVKIKPDEHANVVFEFFQPIETVTKLTTKVVARQHQGTIIIINALENTNVFVDPREAVEDSLEGMVLGLPDSRVSKGKGSLKISNLVPDYYVVEFRLPKAADDDGKPESAKPIVCGGTRCRTTVHLNSCDTLRIEARPDGLTETVSEGCKKKQPQRTKEKTRKKKKKHTTRAHRHSWR